VSVIDIFVASQLVQMIMWSCATIGMYWAARQLYRRHARVWFMPVAVAPLLLIGLILCMPETYQRYIHGAGWLVGLLGPTTVAFAAPIYEKRAIIRAHWPILFVGVIVGSLTRCRPLMDWRPCWTWTRPCG
jgi:putative effector of murein hydrolase